MDTQCSGCAGGQFSDVVSKASCEPHTQCVPGAGAVSKTMQVRREEETEGGEGVMFTTVMSVSCVVQ
jgi:hypothetical protein